MHYENLDLLYTLKGYHQERSINPVLGRNAGFGLCAMGHRSTQQFFNSFQ
jgi:hypothetical protein